MICLFKVKFCLQRILLDPYPFALPDVVNMYFLMRQFSDKSHLMSHHIALNEIAAILCEAGFM